MISLEGLTLMTGRHREAGNILRTFSSYIKDGLIPNMFPEGEHAGLYHTADATMWFFHAVCGIQGHERSGDDPFADSEAARHHRTPHPRHRCSTFTSIRRTGCCRKGRRDIN